MRQSNANLLRDFVSYERIEDEMFEAPNELTPGRDLFEQPLPDGLDEFEWYEGNEVDFIKILRHSGQLITGGPPINLDRLKELIALQLEDDARASEELRQLLRFEIWHRCCRVLNRISENEA